MSIDLNNTIASHSDWKLKFRRGLQKEETFDVASVGNDHMCDLGKWLHSEARLQYGKLPTYIDLVSKHANFHKEAAKIAQLINNKQYAQAEAALETQTSYDKASSEVGVAIVRLRKEANI